MNNDEQIVLGLEELSWNGKKIISMLKEIQPDSKEVCILWDIENINPGPKSLFVDGLMEHAAKYGKVTLTKAFGDWSKRIINKMSAILSNNSFEMIHTHAPVSGKNAADFEMVTQTIEMAIQNPKLQVFILITGDSDFSSLIKSLRRTGKEVYLIYDNKRINENFLALADDYIDFRQIIPSESEEDEIELTPTISEIETISRGAKIEKITDTEINEQLKNSYKLLEEAIMELKSQKKTINLSSVKIRMKILNSGFDEKNFGFSQWSKYISKAVADGIVLVEETKGGGTTLTIVDEKSDYSPSFEKASAVFLRVLKEISGDNKKFLLFTEVHNKAKAEGFDYKKHGYKKLKNYILDLASRNLVEVKINGMLHYVKLVD